MPVLRELNADQEMGGPNKSLAMVELGCDPSPVGTMFSRRDTIPPYEILNSLRVRNKLRNSAKSAGLMRNDDEVAPREPQSTRTSKRTHQRRQMMDMNHHGHSRRRFLHKAAFAAAAFSTPGLFAEELVQTASVPVTKRVS